MRMTQVAANGGVGNGGAECIHHDILQLLSLTLAGTCKH